MSDGQLAEAQRWRLHGLACRLLGSPWDAEDVVQSALERWIAADGTVATPAAWLTTVVTNLCLKQLRLARQHREFPAGASPPEPEVTAEAALGPLQTTQQRESVSSALLMLLERLTGPERAVFVLREAFGYPYAQIAQILHRTEPGCRQLHRRAIRHVAEPLPRSRPDRSQWRQLTSRFLAAADGHMSALEQLLAQHATARPQTPAKPPASRTAVAAGPRSQPGESAAARRRGRGP